MENFAYLVIACDLTRSIPCRVALPIGSHKFSKARWFCLQWGWSAWMNWSPRWTFSSCQVESDRLIFGWQVKLRDRNAAYLFVFIPAVVPAQFDRFSYEIRNALMISCVWLVLFVKHLIVWKRCRVCFECWNSEFGSCDQDGYQNACHFFGIDACCSSAKNNITLVKIVNTSLKCYYCFYVQI